MKTRMTEILGIQYPIMCGGMQNLGYPELAAAVSNAGGIGTINVSMWPDFDDFKAAVRKVKSLTSNPFCVNISLLPNIEISEKIFQYIEFCGEVGVTAIETAGQAPTALVGPIHAAGMKHIHKVPDVRYAVSAEKLGVDIVSIIGCEAAGHPSPNLIGSMVLGAKASKAVKIPLLLGGGIADGRGLAAALALGAEGVVVGTRFVACSDCAISQNHKDWIIQASERDTTLCQRAIKNMIRVANNATARECQEMEKKEGVTLQDLMPIISGAAGKAAYESGDTSKGMFAVGQAVGLIDDVKSAKEIIDDMVTEAEAVFARLNSLA